MAEADGDEGLPLFLYWFEHAPRTEAQSRARYGWPAWVGAAHGLEVEYVFGAPLAPRTAHMFGARERQLSLRMIRTWTEFSKHGYSAFAF